MGLFLVNWGNLGHREISSGVAYYWPSSMNSFSFWVDSLADRSSDPDIRKSYDPDEYPKHFIDLDSYQEFLTTGRIPAFYDSVVMKYGLDSVLERGTLPWAILVSFDSLKASFSRGNWQKAVIYAADIGHYVGDGHNPLHLTLNYNGQFTGQTGVHSRYESGLISRFISEFSKPSGGTINYIPGLRSYVFDFLYENYIYKDSILTADLYAKNLAGGTVSEQYYQEFWNKTSEFNNRLFHNASKRFMEIIYTAWVDAGSPEYGSSGSTEDITPSGNNFLQLPGIYFGKIDIFYRVSRYGLVKINIYDLSGKEICTVLNEEKSPGVYCSELNLDDTSAGVYICRIQNGSQVMTKKLIRI